MTSPTRHQGHRRPFYQSLRVQVGIFLLVLAIVAGVIFFWGWLPYYGRTHIEEQCEQVEAHLATLADALLPYLIQDQLGAVHETLDALLERQPDWRELILTDQRGKQLYPLFSLQPSQGDLIYQFKHELRFRGQGYGQLILCMDAAPLLVKTKRRNQELAVIFSGVFLTAFVFIAVFLELIAGRPARQLARAAEELAEGNYEAQLPAPGANEVGALIRRFDQMRQTIRAKEASLIEARQQAETASEAKSMFLANMSHELRTPLNSVLGFTQLMAAAPEATASQRERLAIIQRGGEHLLDLLNDLLDLSKIEAGTMNVDSRPLRLTYLLTDIENMFLPRAQAKDLHFTVSMAGDLPDTIVSDPRKIRQILLNLVGNALKFTDRGSVELRASWQTPGNLVIEVTDTGPGISSGKIESIFDPFERADQQRSNHDGAGLGLAICKRFSVLLGGTLRVDSEVGRGSTFRASFPVGVPDTLEAVSMPSPELPGPCRDDHQPVLEDSPIVVPREVLAALAEACASLDFFSVNEGLAQVKQADPAAHGRFAELAEDFRYEELENLLRHFLNRTDERQAA